MIVTIAENYERMSEAAAAFVMESLEEQGDFVLGCATGSTPLGLYQRLVEGEARGQIDLSGLRFFNLDEYVGLPADSDQSYAYFIRKHLFDPVGICRERTFIPRGDAADLEEECRRYDGLLRQSGGIDLQILGIGVNGHIGFNEPGSAFIPDTHLVQLDQETIGANARFFSSPDQVPTQALTMGIRPILQARRVLLMASGEAKARAVAAALQGPITPWVPASILQLHSHFRVVLDQEAAALLEEERKER